MLYLGATGCLQRDHQTIPHGGFEYLWCYVVVWTTFAKGETRAIPPVMLVAGYLPVVQGSDHQDSTQFSQPLEGHRRNNPPPNHKAKPSLVTALAHA